MSDCKCNVTVVVEPPKEIIVEAKKEVCLPVVKVLVPGIQAQRETEDQPEKISHSTLIH